MTAVCLADALDQIADHFAWLGAVPPLMGKLPAENVSKPQPRITFNWILEYEIRFPAALAEEARQELAYLKGAELASELQTKINIMNELRQWNLRRLAWEREPHDPSEFYSDITTLGFDLQDEFVAIQEAALDAERFVRRLAKNVRADWGPTLDWRPPPTLTKDATELWRRLQIKLLGERGNLFRLPHGRHETTKQVETAFRDLSKHGLAEAESIEGTHIRLFRIKPPVASRADRARNTDKPPQIAAIHHAQERKITPIVVDVDGQQIFLHGVPYDLTPTAATILAALVKAGGTWVAGKSLRSSRGSRPDRIIAQLPKQVRLLVESHRKNGYRIRTPKRKARSKRAKGAHKARR